jgi:glucoamylase
LADGRVFDMPPQTAKRYSLAEKPSDYKIWAFNHKIRKIVYGNTLRMFLPAPARVRWSVDDWTTAKEHDTHDSTLGVHVADLPTRRLKTGTTIHFKIYWLADNRWDDTDYAVEIR